MLSSSMCLHLFPRPPYLDLSSRYQPSIIDIELILAMFLGGGREREYTSNHNVIKIANIICKKLPEIKSYE